MSSQKILTGTMRIPLMVSWRKAVIRRYNRVTNHGSLCGFPDFRSDLKFISQFNEEIIDKVFESRILTATVSTMLNEVSLGDVALVLADSIYDDDRYITKEELKSLSYAALRIYSEIACEDCPNGIDLNRIFQLDDESFDVILNSQIISNTIGKMVIDRKTDQIVVPTTVLETITIQEESAQVVAKEELKRILQAGQNFGSSPWKILMFKCL